jgi:hypothetical protein
VKAESATTQAATNTVSPPKNTAAVGDAKRKRVAFGAPAP